jgi:hypothetical protein
LAEPLARVGIQAPLAGGFSLVTLHAQGERLDEALCCTRAPDRIELHVHGSVPLVQEIVGLLGGESSGAEVALEEACWEAMAQAPSETGARIALAQSQGILRTELERLIALPTREFSAGLTDLRARGLRARRWLEPTRIALQGAPNAGKSTLFNALVGYTRVVTSAEAGTTRDPILESVCLASWPVELVDTAGLRAVDAKSLEGRGQRLGQRLVASADLTFHLIPHGEPVVVPAGTHALVTHGDRPGAPEHAIDALHEPQAAAQNVGQRLGELLDSGPAWDFSWAAPCTPGQRGVLDAAVAMDPVSEAQAFLRAQFP